MTADSIRAMKASGRKVPALTAYDFALTKRLDAAGVPLILVGDSLGMVVLGYEDTTHVTMDDMLHHIRACARAKPRALLVADLPFESYQDAGQAVANSRRMIEAGAEAVKAEGGRGIADRVKAIVDDGIPFLGHLGMLPQHVKEEGGYHIKGKTSAEHDALLADAEALVEAGAFAVVLELVRGPVARELTERLPIPTIGIGSGSHCDGQILVTTDLLGTSPDYIPRHVHPHLEIPEGIDSALREWVASVRG